MIDFGLLKGMGPQAYWEMSETNWTMKRGSHNGRVGWAEWSWICWWVKGAAAPRQPANKRDKPAQSARLFFPFSSMKSIELWNWFHWIAELEWAERAGKEKKTTKERESAAQLNSLWVGYELAAHLRGSTPQINFTYIQLICLASLAACSAKQRRAHAAHKWRKRGNPTLTLSSLWEWPAKNI